MGSSFGACRGFLIRAGAAMLAFGGAWTLTASTADATDPAFAIEAMPLSAALEHYAMLTGRQLLYSSDLVKGLTAHRVRGRLSEAEALRRLLDGTGLRARAISPKTWVIERDPTHAPVFAASRSTRRGPAPGRAHPGRVVPSADAVVADDILVTGTNIRGSDAGGSPVRTFSRSEIDRSGKGTIAELLATLPQNFGGTGTEDTSLVSSDHSELNTGLGTSANLRGLGSEATLTLINGRRVADSGGKGDFTDLSTIPTGAVERIEVMADGASALYGADAVGGVINIILRPSFNGAETRVRIGSVTAGSSRDYLASQLVGRTWSGGHALLAYEYQHRSALPSTDRIYAASADLRPLGGSDFRSFDADPGTILAFNPATGVLSPRYAIPAGQDGSHVTLADLSPGANLEDPRPGTDLLPDQVRHSIYATAGQTLASWVAVYAEGRYASRRFHFTSPSPQTLLVVTPGNPWYIDTDGSGVSFIGYSFGDELGPVRTRGQVEAWSGTGGTTVTPRGDWQVDAYVSYAEEITHNRNDGLINSSALAEALGSTPDNPATSYSAARDGYFNPYGDKANNQAVLDFVGEGFQEERDRSRLLTASVTADGTLAQLPGGSIKLAIGGQVRRESLAVDHRSFYSGTVPSIDKPLRGVRTITAGFVELALPVFGPGNALPGFSRLDLTVAARQERYSDFGSTTNPRIGLVWEPVAGLRLRGSYGTSFRAPGLTDLTAPYQIVNTQLPNGNGGYAPVLYLVGGNPGLAPERARSLSVGLTLAPTAVKGFRFEATWFRTLFNQRIGRPVSEQILNALIDPSFSPFVRRVDPVHSPTDLAVVQALINDPASFVSHSLPPQFFQAIVDGRVVNSSSIDVRGVDATLRESLTSGENRMTVAVDGAWLTNFKTRITPAAPAIDRVNTLGFPNDFRLRSTLDWSRRGWGGTLSVNYLSGFTDNVSVPARAVGSSATVDVQVRYKTGADSGWLHGLTVSLSVQDLFDTDPPFVNQSSGLGYDASSADPLGRFVSLQLMRQW